MSVDLQWLSHQSLFLATGTVPFRLLTHLWCFGREIPVEIDSDCRVVSLVAGLVAAIGEIVDSPSFDLIA